MESEPIFEFIIYGLVFVGAYVLTLCLWLLVGYLCDLVKR